MGHLDEESFAAKLTPCAGCGGTRYELHSMIDLWQPVMLGEAAGPSKWAHDGEKFVDGTYRITCLGCKQVAFSSDACPRCHAPGALPAALRLPSRIPVPRDCPGCGENQLVVVALVPSVTVHTGGKVIPKPLAELGDDGFHVMIVECDDCGVIGGSGDDCPICGAAAPIRARP
jgi:hypothetical protein